MTGADYVLHVGGMVSPAADYYPKKTLHVNISSAQNVVKAILECAQNLGVRSTVEGIETDSMRDVLRDYGASTLQGYLYSKPVKIDDFVGLKLNGLNTPEDSEK